MLDFYAEDREAGADGVKAKIDVAKAIALPPEAPWQIAVIPKTQIRDRGDLALVYTRASEPSLRRSLGTQARGCSYGVGMPWPWCPTVLRSWGSGNIGPPPPYRHVMEGSAPFSSVSASIDAVPIVLDQAGCRRSGGAGYRACFGAIQLRDIAAPACFMVEERLSNPSIFR